MRNDITLAPNVKQHNFANIAQTDGLSMTSREIANLVEKRHDSVKRTIESLVSRGSISVPQSVEYLDGLGRAAHEYRIGKRDTYIIVAQLSPEFTARLVDRWQELEEARSFTLPQTFAEALRALADKEERVGQLQIKINQDMPKVVFAEAVRDLDGVCCVEEIAKVLGIGRNKFFKKLREDRVLTGGNLPYQRYLDRDYFRVIEKDPWFDKDGKSHPSISTVVTGRGQVWLQHKYSNNGNKV